MVTAEEEHGPTVGLSSFEEREDILHERQAKGDALFSDFGSEDNTTANPPAPNPRDESFLSAQDLAGRDCRYVD